MAKINPLSKGEDTTGVMLISLDQVTPSQEQTGALESQD